MAAAWPRASARIFYDGALFGVHTALLPLRFLPSILKTKQCRISFAGRTQGPNHFSGFVACVFFTRGLCCWPVLRKRRALHNNSNNNNST